MWFLGEPQHLIVSLTFVDPGPVEVSFEELDSGQQKKILTGLQSGILASDIPFQSLYQIWSNEKIAIPTPKDPQPEDLHKATTLTQKETFKLEAQIKTREQKIRERYDYLLAQPARALQAGLKGEENISLLQKVMRAELHGKNRKGVIKFLKEKIKRLTIKAHAEISRQISKASKKRKHDPFIPQETIGFDVVESEQKTVILTPEDLIVAAAEKL
jgi:hypothetical protein